MHVYGSFCLNWCRVRKRPSVITQQMISFVWTQQVWTLDGKVPFMNWRLSTSLMIRSALLDDISRVSCQKGPTRHAYARQIGPFWQDTLDMKMIGDVLTVLTLLILNDTNLCYMISIWHNVIKCKFKFKQIPVLGKYSLAFTYRLMIIILNGP